jgi:hypothetical protein
VADISIKVDCTNARLICNDSTDLAYQSSIRPYSQTNTWTLVYPQDEAGNQPSNGVATNTPSVFFPLAYSANGFNIYLRDYATYSMGDGVYVKMQYKAQNTFNVYCNVDLCQLQCEMQKFYELSKDSCGQLEDPSLMKKMTQINFLYSQALTGILQPLCNIDVPAIIKDMEALFGFASCACCGQGVNLSASPGTSSGCCPVSVPVLDKETNVPPANCPQSYFPVKVYDPTATTIIGVASDADTLVALLNANTAWQVYGFAFNAGNCRVGWVLSNQGVAVPDVYTAPNNDTCIGNEQNYSVPMQDICLGTYPINVTDFPLNAYVDFGDGEVALGNVANVSALIVALNATPTKPSTVTFSDGGASFGVVVNVFNSSCTDFSAPISIYTDTGSSSFLLYGSSHLNYSSTPYPANGGELGYGLRTNTVIGGIAGLDSDNIQWHTLKIGNTLLVSESNTGKIYFWDITNPLQPQFIRYIQLNSVVAGCFTGLPASKGVDNGDVGSFYSLYFPTDFSNMSLNAIYVFEALTGSAWKLDMYDSGSGVLASFQSNIIRGCCPRCIVGNKIYFTLDGTLYADTGVAIPVADGFVATVNLSVTFNSSSVGSINLAGLGTVDPIWAASYDGADTIWFMGKNSVLYKYSLSLAAASIVTLSMGSAQGFKLRGNIKYYLGQLYCSSLGGFQNTSLNMGAMLVDVSAFPSLTQTIFDSYANSYFTYRYVHNILPLGNCLILVTGEGYSATSPSTGERGTIALYKTDGSFVSQCALANGQNIYNLIPIPNVYPYSPTTLT